MKTMKIHHRQLPVIIFLLLLSCSCMARSFKTISVRNGLTDNGIESITQDSEGYMWFATNDGLNRFDGYDLDKYTLKDFGLNFDQFIYAAEDGGGNLWVKSSAGHIYLVDRHFKRLIDKPDSALASIGIPYSDSLDVFVDNVKNLWVETRQTLYHYDWSDNRLSTYSLPAGCHGVASDGIRSFLSLDDGSIIQIGSGNDLQPIQKPDMRLDRIMIDSRGRLWQYGYSSRTIRYYDNQTGSWNDLPENPITDRDFISCAIDDRKGNIWFGSISNGIIVFRYDLSEYQIISHESGNSLTIPNNHISCMYVSDDNILWIGTMKGGAALTSTEKVDIRTIEVDVNEDVKTIIEDKEKNLWIGMDGKGLLKYDPQTGKIRHFTKSDGSIPCDNIIGSAILDDGTMLFTSYGGGVFKWDGRSSDSLWCPDEKFGFSTRFCSHVFKDNYGSIWLLTFNRGIVCLMPDGKWRQFTKENSDLVSDFMTSMTYSPELDKVFVSNRQCIYEIQTNNMTLKKVIDFSQVTNLFIDSRCILWIGTTDGLYYTYMTQDSGICKIDISDGLSHNSITGIGEDMKGDLWVTTNHGFTHIYIIDDPHKKSIEPRCFPYYEDDGTGDGRFTHNSICFSEDGSILLGNDGKVIKVNSNAASPNKKENGLKVTAVMVSGENVRIADNDILRMNHNDNLTVTVSAMDYMNLNKIRFEFRLDGSEDWTMMQGNLLFLNRIPSGKHKLKIRVIGAVHDPEGMVEVGIKVRPPFWKSAAAIVMYALFCLLCALIIIQMFKSRSRKILDQKRHEMDESKLQFFTNISHDLRTPLTMIITPLSKLLREHQDTALANDLELINRSAQTLLDEVNQLLDFKKIDQEKIAFNPTYGDITRFVKEVVNSFNLIFTEDTIKLVTDIDDKPVMMDFDKNKIMRILHNLMSNAFKFNHAKGYVKVSLQQAGDNVEISVTDSGCGISDESKPHIFERFYTGHGKSSIGGNGIGLHIVQEYVKLHEGTISVADNHPSGSIFTISLPITHNCALDEDIDIIDDEHLENESRTISEGRQKILIIEDNLPFRQFLKSSLSDKYKVYEAGNGKAALESLEKHSIDIVISDVMMPVMDGLELCREVKNDIRYSHIPVILLTAIQNKEMTVQGLRDGADEYISKPFDVEVLILKIEKILKRRQDNHERFSDNTAKISELTVSRLDEDLMNRTLAAIEKNLTDSEYSIEDLSAEVGISRSGLYKKLMFITGKSPIEFIRTIKLKKGRDMLEAGETSVSQIAWSVGFSPKQFSKYFKDEYGCLPSEYLKHIRNQA